MKSDNIGKSGLDRTWAVDKRRRPAALAGGVGRDLPGAGLGLTEIEQQVVQRLIRGQTPVAVADALELTVLTTRLLMKSAFARLDVHTGEELRVKLQGGLSH